MSLVDRLIMCSVHLCGDISQAYSLYCCEHVVVHVLFNHV